MQKEKRKKEYGIFKGTVKEIWQVPDMFQWRGRRKVHRKIKDRLFRFLFEKDREALLQIYNALNGTNYQEASKLQIVTIESAVYIVIKNDLAFVLAGTLNLYEHQSTYNPNMPVRFLIYLAEEYQKLVGQAQESLYGTRLISLSTPQCIVFYNGEREMPEEQILRLSDAFNDKGKEADVELRVKMLNINYGHNKELMEKCRVLKEYAEFVDIARRYIAEGKEMQEALNTAILYSIDHDILSDFLRKYRAEVLGMLLEKFDVDKYERSIKAEGREEGIEIGIQEGMQRGMREGTVRINKLACILIEQDRMADLKRSVQEPEYQKQLLREFDL